MNKRKIIKVKCHKVGSKEIVKDYMFMAPYTHIEEFIANIVCMKGNTRFIAFEDNVALFKDSTGMLRLETLNNIVGNGKYVFERNR